MTKYKITIIDCHRGETIFYRESGYSNFFAALDDDLSDIWDIISSDDCYEYDWEVIK